MSRNFEEQAVYLHRALTAGNHEHRSVRHNLSTALKSGWPWHRRKSVYTEQVRRPVGHRARNHLRYSEVVMSSRGEAAVRCGAMEWVTDALRKRSAAAAPPSSRLSRMFTIYLPSTACHDVTVCFCVRAVFRRRLTRWRT